MNYVPSEELKAHLAEHGLTQDSYELDEGLFQVTESRFLAEHTDENVQQVHDRTAYFLIWQRYGVPDADKSTSGRASQASADGSRIVQIREIAGKVKDELIPQVVQSLDGIKRVVCDVEAAVDSGFGSTEDHLKALAGGIASVKAEIRDQADFSRRYSESRHSELKKIGYGIAILLALLILSVLFAPKAHAQAPAAPASKIFNIKFQQSGVQKGNPFAAPFAINFTGCTVTRSAVASLVTVACSSGDNLGGAVYGDVVALWASGSCSGFLKSDGTCSTNAATATALAANGTNCSAGNYPLGVDASGNAEGCTAASGSGTVTNTGTLTSGALIKGNGGADVTASAATISGSTITATLSGNASTATALAADPADCAADNFATAINASGTLTCATLASIAGNITLFDSANASRTVTFGLSGASDPVLTASNGVLNLSTGTLQQGGTAVVLTSRTLTGGAGIAALGDLSADRTVSTDSSEADFLKSGALTCGAATQGKIQVHTTPLQYCDNAATPTLQYSAYGNSSGVATSATALATARAIYGNNFDGTAALTQVIASTYGGTGNGFTKFSGPATAEKTFTLPNASATVLTDNAAVTIAQGGTGTGSTLTGLVRGSASAMTAAELSGVVITSASNVTTPGKVDVMQTSMYCSDAGANDAYACNLSPAATAYVTGTYYRFKANTANTGTASVNFNSLGALTIKKKTSGITTDLADNDIRAGAWVGVVYDGTNAQCIEGCDGNAGSGAPTNSQYLTLAADATLSAERVATAGAGVTITDAGANSTATFAWNPLDVTIIEIHDDFIGSSNTNGSIGNYNWRVDSLGGGTTQSFEDSTANHPGIFSMNTGTTTNDGGIMNVYSTSSNQWLLLSPDTTTNWDSYFIVKQSSTASVRLKIGWSMNNFSATPTDGIWVRYDTGAADTNYTFETRKASTSTTSTTNSIAADTNFHKFRIRSTAAGTILFSVDGGTETSIATNVPSVALSPYILVQTLTTAAKKLHVDYFGFRMTGLSR